MTLLDELIAEVTADPDSNAARRDHGELREKLSGGPMKEHRFA